jgi:hypothetical protein
MFRITVDVAHLAVTQMHPDTAAAGTHVASGRLDVEPFVLRTGVVFHTESPWRLPVSNRGDCGIDHPIRGDVRREIAICERNYSIG